MVLKLHALLTAAPNTRALSIRAPQGLPSNIHRQPKRLGEVKGDQQNLWTFWKWIPNVDSISSLLTNLRI